MIETVCVAVEQGDRGALIVLTHLPLGVGGDTITRALADRVNAAWRRDAGNGDELALPLRDIRDESSGHDTRIVCVLRPGAEVGDCEQRIASTWGVRVRREVQLSAPLAQLMRRLVHEDVAAQRSALAELMAT
jgi:hypothetical protein